MNKKQRRALFLSLTVGIICISLFALVSTETTTYYQKAGEVLNDPDRFSDNKIRIMGLVEEGSVQWDPTKLLLNFRITEDGQRFLAVRHEGVKPDMFREGQGVVIEGVMQKDHTFQSELLLVKHTEEYKTAEHEADKQKYLQTLQ